MPRGAVRVEAHEDSGLSRPARAVRKPTILSRFRKSNRGTVAIEFALIALPFFLLIFGVIEVSLSFTAEQVMSNAVDDISRQLRTGQLKPGDVSGSKLKTLVCDQLFMAEASCPDLVVDLQTYPTFKAVPTTIPLTSDRDVDTTGFKNSPGGAGTINQLRAFYRWPILTDVMKARIESTKGQGKTLLFSTTTWQNEPYL
ncbi:TadE/TadG family type IV pilus assembly protein [Phyllobacterium myrsinacearum]|uniref:Flp pilus assembly protein TadG n=1 Tax=Phyllobacterium myrsinacearum TaxID=28101 RepID=A0A839EIB2_9HYPH|nr:TadE/TadG family type IV pilus assembly protein [Phyllobacterium myrsinacearum]MBA8877294.1 Flp pilus assembly protein TadG [Phyllobacterium myrsinacearum]